MSGESIYSWIPAPETKVVKPARHRSKHNPMAPPVGSTFVAHGTTRITGSNLGEEDKPPRNIMRKDAGTFYGTARERRAPTEFIRKGARCKEPTSNTTKGAQRCARRKAPLPDRRERPTMGLKSDKNFVVANAVENILAAPKRRVSKEEESTAYLRKADYGKVPEYLKHVQREVEEEKEIISAMMGESGGSQRGREADIMPDEERAALLDALKHKWDDVNFHYQKITHANNEDTIGKKRRKERLEQELEQLEKDIKLLSSKRPIAVA